MNTLLSKTGGLVRGRIEVLVSHTPATKTEMPEPEFNRIISSTLRFSGHKPTRGQIRDLDRALKTGSLPVLQYRAKWHDVIDPSDIVGNVISLHFKKNTNQLVVETYSGVEHHIRSWPTFSVGYTLQGNIAVFVV